MQHLSDSVDDEVVVARLSGRMNCTKCGEIYHAESKPPMREGLCDKCNGPLFFRSDDRPDTIRERLRVFRENTAPVVDYYQARECLLRIDAMGEPEEVFQAIVDGCR
jgi:adenylate kinase